MVRFSTNRKRRHNIGQPTTKKSITFGTAPSNTACVHRISENHPANDDEPNRVSKICSIRDDLIPTSRQTSLLSFFAKGDCSKSRQSRKNKNGKSTSGTKVLSAGADGTFSSSRQQSQTVSTSSMHETSTKALLPPSSTCHSRIQKQKKLKTFTQVYIDCGQSKFGQILCNKCGMLYMPGVLEDEIQHKRLCQSYTLGIPCNRGNVKDGKQVDVWTNESHTNCVDEATIVLWRPCTKPEYKKKSKERQSEAESRIFDCKTKDRPSQWPLLARMIAKDLGTDEEATLNHLTNVIVFLYIGKNISNAKKNKDTATIYKTFTRYRIVGVATVQILGNANAYRMISLYERSREPVTEAKLGVGLLWTHPIARNRGIATKLINSAREHAIFGMQVAREDVAFSNPTQAGYNFALRYRNNKLNADSDERTKFKDNHRRGLNQECDPINSRKNQEESCSLCWRDRGPLVYEMNL